MRTRLFLIFCLIAGFGTAQQSIYDIIKTDSCPGAEVNGEPELYVGDDLFNLINGGAELYHEYGFVEVLTARLSINDSEPVRVEIYDMGSPEGAWGIFSSTNHLPSVGAPAYGSANGVRGEGYGQWIRGHYMAYMYFDTLQDTDLRSLGACLSANIAEDGVEPRIKTILWKIGDKCDRTVYFLGNLGLSSIYNFHYKDVFGYTEGAAGIFPDFKVFVLDYMNESDCIENYNTARDFFLNSSKYHDQVSLRGSFHMKDRKEQQIDCYLENSCLILFISTGEIELNDIREKVVVEMSEIQAP